MDVAGRGGFGEGWPRGAWRVVGTTTRQLQNSPSFIVESHDSKSPYIPPVCSSRSLPPLARVFLHEPPSPLFQAGPAPPAGRHRRHPHRLISIFISPFLSTSSRLPLYVTPRRFGLSGETPRRRCSPRASGMEEKQAINSVFLDTF